MLFLHTRKDEGPRAPRPQLLGVHAAGRHRHRLGGLPDCLVTHVQRRGDYSGHRPSGHRVRPRRPRHRRVRTRVQPPDHRLMMFIRHKEKRVRRSEGRAKGPAAFTGEDRGRFSRNLRQLVQEARRADDGEQSSPSRWCLASGEGQSAPCSRYSAHTIGCNCAASTTCPMGWRSFPSRTYRGMRSTPCAAGS